MIMYVLYLSYKNNLRRKIMNSFMPLETPEKDLAMTLEQLSALVDIIESRTIPISSIPQSTTPGANPSKLLHSKENQNLVELTAEIRNMIQEIKSNDDPDLTAQYNRIAKILYHTLTNPSNDNLSALRLASKSTALEAQGYNIAKYIAHTKKALIGMLSHYFLEITFGAVAMAMLGPIAGPIAFLAAREAVEFLGLDKLRKPYEEEATKAKHASTKFYQAKEKLDSLEGKIVKHQKVLQNISENPEISRSATSTKK